MFHTVLQIIWFILIAVLWTGYLVLEGFGIGSGMLMRIVAHTDRERTQVQRTFGPVWDGNEVWLLTAGGATFAAFPLWYATMFSGMYLALFVILLCLIVRICSIEWRGKIASQQWRSRWDWAHTIAAWLVPILFGVAFANLVQGMNIAVVDKKTPQLPIDSSVLTQSPAILSKSIHNFVGEGAPAGSVFLSLLTPYTILGGIALCFVFLAQGSLWLAMKTDGHVQQRARHISRYMTLLATVFVAILALWGQLAYAEQAWAWLPLVIAALAIIGATALSWLGKYVPAFFTSAVAIAAAVAWIFTAMAPYVMKSSKHAVYSLSLYQASSTLSTLLVMLVVAVILVPIVLAYTAWAYTKMAGTISVHDVDDNPGLLWNRIKAASHVSGSFFQETR